MKSRNNFENNSFLPTEPKLKIIQTNLNGIENKRNEIDLFLNEINPEILCVSETHLTEANSQIIKFEGYNSYHFCRSKKSHGGSAI